MTFHIGQKVVCVNAGSIPGLPIPLFGWDDWEAPIEGEIYTIKAIRNIRDQYIQEMVTVFDLFELRRSPLAIAEWGEDCGYDSSRFCPLIERKTSIAIFQSLLTPAKVREPT